MLFFKDIFRHAHKHVLINEEEAERWFNIVIIEIAQFTIMVRLLHKKH